MLTLRSLKAEVDTVRTVAEMAHSEAVKTRHLVDTHAHVFVVYGEPLPGQRVVAADGPSISLKDTREDLDSLQCGVYDIAVDVKAIRSDVEALKVDVGTLKVDVGTLKVDVAALRDDVLVVKSDIAEVKSDVAILKSDFKLMSQRQDGMDQRQDRMDQRQDRMDQRQDRMDQNIAAIMRHMGIDPVEA